MTPDICRGPINASPSSFVHGSSIWKMVRARLMIVQPNRATKNSCDKSVVSDGLLWYEAADQFTTCANVSEMDGYLPAYVCIQSRDSRYRIEVRMSQRKAKRFLVSWSTDAGALQCRLVSRSQPNRRKIVVPYKCRLPFC